MSKYQVNGEFDHVLPWLRDQDPATREAMLSWLAKLGDDPYGVATVRKIRPGVPGMIAEVPHTSAYVDYTIVDQFHTVMILKVVDVEMDEEPRIY